MVLQSRRPSVNRESHVIMLRSVCLPDTHLDEPRERKSLNGPGSGHQHTRQARIQTEALNGLDILSSQSDDERWRRDLPMALSITDQEMW
jgi:hypothetical protein